MALARALLLAVICLLCADAASAREIATFAVGFSLDRGADRLDQLSAESRYHDVRRLRGSWSKGVTARVRRSAKARTFADFVLVARGGGQQRGVLRIPAGKSIGRITLSSSGSPGVVARLRTGSRPSLVIEGLPPGTREITVTTAGSGRDVIRTTAPCVAGERRAFVSATVSFADSTPTRGAGTDLNERC